jgi:hypothetical protein
MRIRLAVRPCLPVLADRLAADPFLARALGPKPNAAVGWLFPKWFDAHGDVLPRLLTLAAGHEVSFLRDVSFDEGDCDAAPVLEAIARVTVRQTRAEVERTRQSYLAEALHPTAGRWAVRRPSRIWLSGAVRDDTVAHVDQWTGEFVVSAAVASGMKDSALRGSEFLPLHQVRGDVRQDAFHLTSTRTLGPVVFDSTAWVDPDGTPRRLGALMVRAGDVAEALEAGDFLRTSEPWGPWQTPAWVVSQSVRSLFKRSGWRGWAFRPVLEAGSALHERHASAWARAVGLLKDHGRATVPV